MWKPEMKKILSKVVATLPMLINTSPPPTHTHTHTHTHHNTFIHS